MGCISSKNAMPESADLYGGAPSCKAKRRPRSGSFSTQLTGQSAFTRLEKIKEDPEREEIEENKEVISVNPGHSGDLNPQRGGPSGLENGFSLNLGRLTVSELVTAGWPSWLSSVAGEAIDGWLPMRSDSFERLDKIGQGTYSIVYRARQLATGRYFAVKKVRFDNLQPESVRFMSREITILRRLSHPNVMKLEGIIASQFSNHIYLVFEYMEHDLAKLVASPHTRFTEAQIKCYMNQILSGVEHCHSRGILHRDIKTANILVNNEGIVKLADFGLANFMRPENQLPLTSRVVTLWYRPPELFLGSTDYGEAVDLWSVGCVFAELLMGRPLLKGRTEVEQLHKIFKLCGSPSDDYWTKSKLPLANIFKPHNPYKSTLRERCKELPTSAVSLIETLLSIEPCNRGDATSALNSKYFYTKPYACDPESLPKYPPTSDMEAKIRRRSGFLAQPRNSRRVQKPLQELTDTNKVIPTEVAEGNHRSQGESNKVYYKRRGTSMQQPYNIITVSEASQLTDESQGSNPLLPSTINACPRPKPILSSSRYRRVYSMGVPRLLQVNGNAPDSDEQENHVSSEGNMAAKLDTSDLPHEPCLDAGNKKKSRVAFSGPVIYHYEEESHEQDHPNHQVRQRSRFCQES